MQELTNVKDNPTDSRAFRRFMTHKLSSIPEYLCIKQSPG